MNAPWPPPPDLDSIKELVRNADTEKFIASGSPADEYDSEAEDLVAVIGRWPTQQLTVSNLMPVIETIWQKSFNQNERVEADSATALLSLAQQIARFFGPDATPQVRSQTSV